MKAPPFNPNTPPHWLVILNELEQAGLSVKFVSTLETGRREFRARVYDTAWGGEFTRIQGRSSTPRRGCAPTREDALAQAWKHAYDWYHAQVRHLAALAECGEEDGAA